MKKIAINPQRINHLMKIFGLSQQELLQKISEGLKNPIKKDEIFVDSQPEEKIKINHLKRIDERVFKKGLSFYTDPTNLKDKKASIFFRKDAFNANLSFGDREITHKIETQISSLSALSKLSKFEIKRKLKTYNCNQDNASKIGYEIREQLLKDVDNFRKDKDFLKNLIDMLSEKNILVLEFVETWNKKNKTTINGFFITPYTITLKRQQKSFKREIFTLAHELGHYLLNEEELDHLSFECQTNANQIERWCNEFAFTFLMGKAGISEINNISLININIDNQQIQELSNKYHISRLSLFTYLVTNKIINQQTYNKIKENLKEEYHRRENETKQKKEKDKLAGIIFHGRSPKPIVSPLEKNIYSSAFFEGVVEEYEVLEHFKVKDITKILYEQILH